MCALCSAHFVRRIHHAFTLMFDKKTRVMIFLEIAVATKKTSLWQSVIPRSGIGAQLQISRLAKCNTKLHVILTIFESKHIISVFV